MKDRQEYNTCSVWDAAVFPFRSWLHSLVPIGFNLGSICLKLGDINDFELTNNNEYFTVDVLDRSFGLLVLMESFRFQKIDFLLHFMYPSYSSSFVIY